MEEQRGSTFFTVSAAAAKSSFPTLVDPVNPIFRTVSDAIRVSPAPHQSSSISSMKSPGTDHDSTPTAIRIEL